MADRAEIDEVLQRTDIVGVIEKYVTLKRAGSRFRGLCPFHHEKTPSFNVDPEKGFYKCFGCGEGGDAIKFVQKVENLSFGEALERLAQAAGVPLTNRGRDAAEDAVERTQRDRLFQVNDVAQSYYSALLQDTPAGLEYARDRGLLAETIAAFHIGYAPDVWDGLVQHIRRSKLSIEDAETAGLIYRSERGSYIDHLRGRLIFPIHDVHGRTVAFGGRIIGESGPGRPKYWNCPETPVFVKRSNLYGLSRARKAIAAQGYAIIVEGYMDVVTAHQHGFENVVATLGTAVTDEHARVLATLARKALLAFDADAAGLKAAYKAAEIFQARDVEVRVIDFPPGDDPDSLLRSGRRGELTRRIDSSVSMLEYELRIVLRNLPEGEDPSRIELFRQLIPILAKAGNDVELDRYVRIVARHHPAFSRGSAAAEDRIRQDVAAFSREKGGASGNLVNRAAVTVAQEHRQDATVKAERNLIRALVSDDISLSARVARSISVSDFETARNRELVDRLLETARNEGFVGRRAESLLADDEHLSGLLSDIVMSDDEPLTEPVVDGGIRHLKNRSFMREQRTLTERINSGIATSQDVLRFHELQRATRGGSRMPQAN